MQKISRHKGRFGLWVSCAIIVLGTFFGLVLILRLQNQLLRNTLNQVGKQEIVFAQDVADLLETRITNLQERLILLTHISQIKSGDPAVCNAKLKEIFSVMGSKVGNLSRVSAAGLYYCAIDPTRIGLKAAQVGDFIEQILEDPEHKPVLSRAFKQSGRDKPSISMHVPVWTESGQFAGTLGGAIYIEEFPEKYLKGLAFVERGFVEIMDDNGDVLYHPEEKYVGRNYWVDAVFREVRSQALDDMAIGARAGKSRVGTYQRFGEQRLAAYAAAQVFPNRRWLVLVTVSAREVESLLDKSGFQATFLWIGLIVGAVLFSIPIFVFFYLMLPALAAHQRSKEFLDGDKLFELDKVRLENEVKQLKKKLEKLIPK